MLISFSFLFQSREFNELVNMTADELEEWLKSEGLDIFGME